MSKEEKVVAVVDATTTDGEVALACECTEIEMRASGIMVETDQDYAIAGEFGVELRNKMAEVTSFFAPMKKAAHDAHKQICDKEKQYLAPLKSAESMLKAAMSGYTRKKEEERRRAEEQARLLAQKEAEEKMRQAIEAEAAGNKEAADDAFADAAIAEFTAQNLTIEHEQTAATKGVSVRTDYEIVEVDQSKVPVEVSGMVIRPVDTAAVLSLIRASKGAIKIDGITYREVTKTSFRRS